MTESVTLEQLKTSLGGYARSRVFDLAEAANELKVSEKYLFDLVTAGKIKAFKIGEHWFLEEDWLNDFRGAMRGLLGEAIGDWGLEPHQSGWTRPIGKKARRPIRLVVNINFSWLAEIHPQLLLKVSRPLGSLVGAVLTTSLEGVEIFFSQLAGLIKKNTVLASQSASRIIVATRQFYNYLLNSSSRFVGLCQLKLQSFSTGFIRQFNRFLGVVKIKPLVVFSFQTVSASVVLAVLTIGLSYLCLPLASFGLHRELAAQTFLSATYKTYNLPVVALGGIIVNLPINDENLTHSLYRLAGQNPPGQVAGAFEYKLRE